MFFALVGPVGTDLRQVQSILEQELRTVAYEPVEVRMSRLLEDVKDFAGRLRAAWNRPEHERIEAFMDCGDQLRKRANNGAAVALLSAVFLVAYRQQNVALVKARARAFIFNSLKHPDEVHLLRRLYGDALIVISVYSPRRTRMKALARRIAKTRGAHTSTDDEQLAERLIDRDAKGSDDKLGQRVADTFHLADYFVREGAKPDLHRELQRLIEILFQHPYRTPTRDEFAMFQARGVALRSADLSRQVGAVICDADGSIVATGCNEVPKPGGGTYWEGDQPDYRDFQHGSDANALGKRSLVGELLEQLHSENWLSPRIQKLGIAKILAKAVDGKQPLFKETRATALLEFGRVVHAEMNALADAARRGIAVKGATLYCTTFPCHICARHILAAGIRRVVYVEPYPKSLAVALYPNAIRVDEGVADGDAVEFDAFVGIAPSRFMDSFRAPPRRKDDLGYAVSWEPKAASPRFETVIEAHGELEAYAASIVERDAKQLGLT